MAPRVTADSTAGKTVPGSNSIGGFQTGGGSFDAATAFGPQGVDPNAAATGATALTVNSGRTQAAPNSMRPPRQTPEGASWVAPAPVPVYVPVEAYMATLDQYYYTIGYKSQYDQIAIQLRNAGYIEPWAKGKWPSHDQVMSAYENMLVGASYNKSLTPDQFLQVKSDQGFAAAGNTAPKVEGPDLSPRTDSYTSTDSQVTQTNKFDAHAILDDALGKYLGRQATKGELSQFKAMLNSQERGNALVTTGTGTTTTTPTVGSDGAATGDSTSTRVTGSNRTGGVNQEQIAEDFAKSQDTYAGTQANTTLMGWLEEAIRGGSVDRMI